MNKVERVDPAREIIARVVDNNLAWGDRLLVGTPAEKIRWIETKAEIAGAVIDALFGAGYTLKRLGAEPSIRLERYEDQPYRQRVRAYLDIAPATIGAEQSFDIRMLADAEFRARYLPRLLADILTAVLKDDIAKKIHAAIATEARRVETLQDDSVHEGAGLQGIAQHRAAQSGERINEDPRDIYPSKEPRNAHS